jgi:alanine racemase
MTLRTRVAQIQRICAGDPVGYGATWRAPEDCFIATLPIGYADGVPVTSANGGCVRLGRRMAPIVGRVSMDFITVDAGSEAPGPAIGDEATLFGSELPVEAVAAAAGTHAYALLVGVGARVPRVIVA